MSAPQTLLQAAVTRLAARLGSGLADTAATLSLLAQDAPVRLQQEFNLFWEEVEQEAARLDREAGQPGGASGAAAPRRAWSGPGGVDSAGSAARVEDPQDAIDALRAQVARLARRLDGPSGTEAGAAQPGASRSQGSGPA